MNRDDVTEKNLGTSKVRVVVLFLLAFAVLVSIMVFSKGGPVEIERDVTPVLSREPSYIPTPAVKIAQDENNEEIDDLRRRLDRAEKSLALRDAYIKGQKRSKETENVPVVEARSTPEVKSVNYSADQIAIEFKPTEVVDGNYSTDFGIPKAVRTVRAQKIDDKKDLLLEGTIFKATLNTAVNSLLPGRIKATVVEDVYSEDGSRVLIPKGSRLLGSYGSTTSESLRIGIIWNRIIHENWTVSISSPGVDSEGRSGVSGELDTHFWRRFGSSVLLSSIDLGVAATSGSDSVVISRPFSSAAERALDSSINIPTEIYAERGLIVGVFLNSDLLVSEDVLK